MIGHPFSECIWIDDDSWVCGICSLWVWTYDAIVMNIDRADSVEIEVVRTVETMNEKVRGNEWKR